MAADYILGLDYGEKRVGTALAHTIARLPRPHVTIHNTEDLFKDIQELVQKEHVGLVVVGLPRGMDGGFTAQTFAAEKFAKQLEKVVDVPVEMADETLTSIDAETHLGKDFVKAEIDAMAAAFILERYLAEHPKEIRHEI